MTTTDDGESARANQAKEAIDELRTYLLANGLAIAERLKQAAYHRRKAAEARQEKRHWKMLAERNKYQACEQLGFDPDDRDQKTRFRDLERLLRHTMSAVFVVWSNGEDDESDPLATCSGQELIEDLLFDLEEADGAAWDYQDGEGPPAEPVLLTNARESLLALLLDGFGIAPPQEPEDAKDSKQGAPERPCHLCLGVGMVSHGHAELNGLVTCPECSGKGGPLAMARYRPEEESRCTSIIIYQLHAVTPEGIAETALSAHASLEEATRLAGEQLALGQSVKIVRRFVLVSQSVTTIAP